MKADLADTQALEARLYECFAPLRRADEGFRRSLLERGSWIKLGPGASVRHQGQACTHLALVLRGVVRVYKLSESGHQITLYRIEPGDSCILTASCILSGRGFPAFAETESEIDALLIPSAQVQQWTAESGAWRDFIFGLLARRLTEVIAVVEEVAFRRMDERVAAFLLRSGRRSAEGPILLTHQEIAAELGTSREVVSRILKDLEGEGLIRRSRGQILIRDRSALRAKARPR